MQFDQLKRREFITLLGGVAAAWPLAVRAQQAERMRRIGALMILAADDPQSQARLAAFQQSLQQLGWSDGRNVQINIRWHENDADRARTYAQELIALAPDIFLAEGTVSMTALQHVTRTLPIVFANVGDPVGAGVVDSLSRPGGNATGFMNYEYGFSGKWLELLKQIAPQVTRAAVFRDPAFVVGIAQFGAIQAVAPALGVEITPISVHDVDVIERAVEAFARQANGGLIVTAAGILPAVTRDLIITLAARHKLPAVYPFRYLVTAGGLVSYGPDNVDMFRRAAGYVDRILKGEKPADLPVQAPTKYELVVNLKTAKAIGLEVPASVLARADAVIE
jgi:putative ABC transport system substrate-binding protein